MRKSRVRAVRASRRWECRWVRVCRQTTGYNNNNNTTTTVSRATPRHRPCWTPNLSISTARVSHPLTSSSRDRVCPWFLFSLRTLLSTKSLPLNFSIPLEPDHDVSPNIAVVWVFKSVLDANHAPHPQRHSIFCFSPFIYWTKYPLKSFFFRNLLSSKLMHLLVSSGYTVQPMSCSFLIITIQDVQYITQLNYRLSPLLCFIILCAKSMKKGKVKQKKDATFVFIKTF